MDIRDFIPYIMALPSYKTQIVHIEHLSPREPSYAELEKPLPPLLDKALRKIGISALYRHQALAVNKARSGENIMVVTPAASGKTLCYNLPVLEEILEVKEHCALYLFPTKALAQNQLRNLAEIILALPQRIRYATFDGDTPQEDRAEIKRTAQIVLTNPDMLHLGILPNHGSWSRVFRRLRYVVLDEAHIYRGIFGSHVGNVLRRLQRICTAYGSSPQFICCSATIANPQEHISRLVNLPFEMIDEDGSPHGGKEFAFWNPPVLDKAKSIRRSANSEAAFLFSELVRGEIRTLTFARTRQITELIYKYAREQLADPVLAERIKPYRAGYLPEERRQIERELFERHLWGAVATTALELGIDIGDLGATVLCGYPGSIASTWQQAGRSGRNREPSLSFLIGLDNPLDQYIMHHPDFFFHKTFEQVLIDPDNFYIMKSHLLCAAWESPLVDSDEKFFGRHFTKAREELEVQGVLRKREKRWFLSPSVAYPAEGVNLRSSSSQCYSVVDISQGRRQLETVEATLAFSQIHPGAIYLHQGESYLVAELDLANHVALVVPVSAPYYTRAKEIQELRIIRTVEEKRAGATRVFLGEVEVTSTVVGFKKKRQFTEEVVGEEPLDLPSQTFETAALWFDIPREAMERVSSLDFAGGLHAVEHAAIALLPLFALCDRDDIGGVSTPLHVDTGKAQIFIYDAYPGGIGISAKGFELIEQLWEATLRVVKECPCEEGCPGCVQSPKCGNNNEPLDKKAAQYILEALLQTAGHSAEEG